MDVEREFEPLCWCQSKIESVAGSRGVRMAGIGNGVSTGLQSNRWAVFMLSQRNVTVSRQ